MPLTDNSFDTPRPDAEGADLSAAATSNGWPMPDWGINGPGGDPKYGTDLSKGAVAGIVVSKYTRSGVVYIADLACRSAY